MKKYLLITKISIEDSMQYRLDFFLKTMKYATMVMLMALVWIGVQQDGNEIMTNVETVRYFFLAAILYSLSNFHTWYIEEDIKLGYLSKYLTKPISPVLRYFAFESGTAIVETVFKFVVILPLLYLLGFTLNLDLLNFSLFLIYIPIIFIFAFNFFSLISGLSFWFHDVFAIRWSVIIITRLLSGTLVPLNFFPQSFQQLSFYLPFQHLAYTPIQMMNKVISLQTAITGLGILLAWIIIMTLIRSYTWQLGIKSYESTGI